MLDAVSREHPDVVILDIRLPPTRTDEGIRAAVQLHEHHPGLGVLVLSTYVESRWALTLLDQFPGGIGYLLKDRVDDVVALLDALRRVATGGIALDPDVVSSLIAAGRRSQPIARLTPRELEVLELLAQGWSNTAIAAGLFMSVKTVESHVASVFRSLDLVDVAAENRRVKATLAYLAAR